MKPLKLSIVACSLMLVGCSTIKQLILPLPANLSTPCKDAELLSAAADMGELLQVATNTAYSLKECSARNRALVDWARGE